MKLFKKAKKGFTLVELIVVIAIVAILAAVSVAGYYGFIESAKQSAADQEASQVKLALQAACTPLSQKEYDLDGNHVIDPVKETLTTTYAWNKSTLVPTVTTNLTAAKVVADLGIILNYNGALPAGASIKLCDSSKVVIADSTTVTFVCGLIYTASNTKTSAFLF